MRKTVLHFILVASTLITTHPSVFAQPGGFGGRRGFGGGTGERIEPEDLKFEQGVAAIPDRETFEKLSYQGPDVMIDGYLANLEFVKFIIENPGTDGVKVYFMNTESFRAHPHFMGAVGIGRGSQLMRGALTYLPRLRAPDGTAGLYIMDFEPNDSYSFEEIRFARDTLTGKMPILNGKIAFHPLRGNVARYEQEKSLYESADFPVHTDADLYGDIAYLPLNIAESFGLLRIVDNDTRPSPRDVVICRTLPNQMPRVAGVITEVRQTPLSHVNLRAVQDRIPNAFIAGALQEENVNSLVGKLVHYQVTQQGYKLRAATKAEVDKHFESIRPSERLTPVRDLTMQEIRPLRELKFEDSSSVGVKAANLAAMHTFEMPAGTIPDGYAIPFHFYDAFMQYNGFYALIDDVLSSQEFINDRNVQEKELKLIRSLIEDGRVPAWMSDALGAVQKEFPEGSSIRCRSSTNNEDLPGFSGAGLYDSFTHNPAEGHLSKSIKQVFASLWNFRAFEEREFYRVDHKLAAMGVLLHSNYSGELANGVAVSDDILYETQGNYYLNTQVGEDLVTNPDEESVPEEVLLAWWKRDGSQVMRRSNRANETGQLLNDQHLDELRDRLARIHSRFRKLYGHSEEDKFAMEIEFKITKDDELIIKQARPWVYAALRSTTTQ